MKTILVCQVVKGPVNSVPGSIIKNCATCGQAIWVAPSGQELLKENDHWAVCVVCGVKLMQEHPGTVEPPTPAQMEEVRAAYRSRMN